MTAVVNSNTERFLQHIQGRQTVILRPLLFRFVVSIRFALVVLPTTKGSYERSGSFVGLSLAKCHNTCFSSKPHAHQHEEFTEQHSQFKRNFVLVTPCLSSGITRHSIKIDQSVDTVQWCDRNLARRASSFLMLPCSQMYIFQAFEPSIAVCLYCSWLRL